MINVENFIKIKFFLVFFLGDLDDMFDFLVGIKVLVVDVLNEIGKGECVVIYVVLGVLIGCGLGLSVVVVISIVCGLYKYFN